MKLEQLKSFPFFQDLDPEFLVNLAKYSSLKYYEKNQPIFIHGDYTEYFYLIISGWVKLFRDTLDGQESFVGLVTTGNIIGEINFNKRTHFFSASTIDKTEVILFPYNLFKETIENNGAFALKIIKALSSVITELELQFEHMATMNAAQRIGCFILRLHHKEKNKIELKLPYDKTLLASYLGMKRETFSRALHELEKIGIIIKNNSLTIENINRLIKFSCISCSLTYDSCKDQN